MKKAVLFCCLGVAACSPPAPNKVKPAPHYVVGQAWQQSDGIWVYPREDFSYQATGLAVRQPPIKKAAPLTTDGEVRSALSMTASHPTLQLPALVTVTNLENGREVRLRINDRGPSQSGRILGVTPKVADLLGMGAGPARVSIVVDELASRHLAELLPGGPVLQINTAPLEQVQQTQLTGPQAHMAAGQGGASTPVQETSGATADASQLLADLPATWRQGMPRQTHLWVETTDFTSRYTAAREAAREGATVVAAFVGQEKMWAVRHGPFATISEADAALKRSLAAGLTGSHIVVE
ncbi:hypothetical protein ACI01nite_04540 [Acetobacter cibinongensis]|uniref:Lipoprotein n=1 Tax=Acetobacter cibinongensis TaxID=146475 RepID=A0A0D6N5M5_9PROT|nr:RlpA-like double-psi beta-barrel domain-containing protein [Acetobacter cibinongensis]GAN61254.1 lipoprotein [Acetobacter cibinongensis]GEL57852.1 hypothetical protein ACI01nite_04540 [Acetobacter cibinongensis]